jgi:hypothetical protein
MTQATTHSRNHRGFMTQATTHSRNTFDVFAGPGARGIQRRAAATARRASNERVSGAEK